MNRATTDCADSAVSIVHPGFFHAPRSQDATPAWQRGGPGEYDDLGSILQYRVVRETGASAAVLARPHMELGQGAVAHQTPYESTEVLLRLFAGRGDEAAFVRLAKRINWATRSADEIVEGVHLALRAGAHLRARKLASQGAELHPDDEELSKMAYVLAPPRVIRTDIPATGSMRANQTWLRENATEYAGKWVAVHRGTLLAVGESAREVWDRLEDTKDTLITKVY